MLIDGMNLLFQMFYGMPSRIVNKNGKAIHGTLGFVGALLKIINMTSPTHIVVLFDGECKNERKDLDSEYKANRPDYSELEDEDIPFSQLPDIYKALDYIGIKHMETSVCEADDWIASYALNYGVKNEVIIASYDSDFFQLISDNVKVIRYRGDQTVIWDKLYLMEKLGIAPGQYALFKSLTGDTADNIKGVSKVGPKTAAHLVNKFADIDELIINADKIEKQSVRESVINSTDRIILNYKLIKLDGKEDMPLSEEEMIYYNKGLRTREVLKGIGLTD